MVLISGRGATRNLTKTINRTWEGSGGSLGGNKKAGTVYMGPSWPLNAVSLNRANKDIPTVMFAMKWTTMNPVQRSNAGTALIRGV
jgi:hypothetical protein